VAFRGHAGFLAMTVPPVRMAMSSSMALRRSPKPGALTAQVFQDAGMLLTTGSQRLAFDFLGDDQQRPASLGHLLQDRQRSRMLLIFCRAAGT